MALGGWTPLPKMSSYSSCFFALLRYFDYLSEKVHVFSGKANTSQTEPHVESFCRQSKATYIHVRSYKRASYSHTTSHSLQSQTFINLHVLIAAMPCLKLCSQLLMIMDCP